MRLRSALWALLLVASPAWAMSPAEIATAYVAAWNAHDAGKAASFMADDVTYLDVTVGEPQLGREAARDNVIAVFIKAVPDLKWEMKGEPVASADGVAFEWTFSGTNTGAWGPDTPATNQSFSFDGVTLMRVADGKITYQGDYYDGLGFQKQLGWIE
ncbi:MAG: ester cyclase [Geminicoccaceae bacterium]